MAIKNDYEAGTVTVSAGGTVVTGVATMWVAADIQPGDTFKVKNLDAIILSVDSNTQVTLKEAWTGGALASSAYAIRYQPDGSRYSAAVKDLVGTLGNGNIQALAGLTGAINKIPYFIGAGAMALADFKDWAVSFLSLTPAADKLAYFSGSTTSALTDFKAWGRSMLGLTVAADKGIYFTDANTAALFDLTTAGRALAGAANAAAQKTALALVKADVGLGNVDNTSDVGKPVSTAQATALLAKAGGAMSGPLDIAYTVDANFGIRFTQTYNIASGGTLRIGTEGSGFLVVTSHTDGSTAIYIVGGGGVVLVSQSGTVFGRTSDGGGMKLQYATAPTGYYFGNVTGIPHTLGIAFLRTRPQA